MKCAVLCANIQNFLSAESGKFESQLRTPEWVKISVQK